MKKQFFQCILVLLLGINLLGTAMNEKAAAMSIQGKSTWLWNTEELIENKDEIITFLKANGVNELYLQINRSVSNEHYQQFIERASMEHIKVYALDGAATWATVKGGKSLATFFEWVENYQHQSNENQQFTGVHLDVEPYLLPGWSSSYKKTVLNYQKMIRDAAIFSKSHKLSLGVDIPFWFDEKYFQNEFGKGNLAQWVISETDEVAIMAYRDRAEGPNGIIQLVKNEMDFAFLEGKKVKVGVETAPSSEGGFLTFFEEGQDEMNRQIEIVDRYYSNDLPYHGIAIHHLDSWMKLP
ncbi:hypothetical protein [Rossellomorea aquimaris]|uniref:hypothetical protein n=1 Tax=Rossellomorea aquimaris TaxID=189382 RepID=UPI0007D07C71|nr:hypothetical protein [Rossellomorea aquimaris]